MNEHQSETALGPVGTGIWSSGLRYGDVGEIANAAAELESLGFTSLWIPDLGGDVFSPIENLLRSTRDVTVATGILNLWMHPAQETAARHAALTHQYGNRFLVGIGVSHAPVVDRAHEAGTYKRPLVKTGDYLDELDEADPPLAVGNRLIGAQGPKMLAHRPPGRPVCIRISLPQNIRNSLARQLGPLEWWPPNWVWFWKETRSERAM